jgi:ribosome maturation factor RimP
METSPERNIKAGVDLDRVQAAVAPVLSAHGVTLVDVEWLTDRVGWVLRITIDREVATAAGPTGVSGVTLDDCVEVSRDVSAVLDVTELIPQRYHLEVSSPGLDRPLRSPADFARFLGHLVRVKLTEPAPDGQRVLRGQLADCAPGMIAVLVDGKKIEARLPTVAEANLVFELPKQPKPGGLARHAPRKAGPRKATSVKSKR